MTAAPSPNPALKRLSALPFREQLALIDELIAAGESLPELLSALGALRDHEPLAQAVRRLGRTGKLAEQSIAERLSDLLQSLPDSGVQRLLRGLEQSSLPPDQLAPAVAAVVAAVRHLPLERLAGLCLMDRWLKNADPAARAELCDEAVAQCREALAAEVLEELADELLLRVPGRELEALEKATGGGATARAWQARRERFARRVLGLLGALPKSLSQANAEELLARRVYTDPGHFLAELLQNAEDAGATRWSVRVAAKEVRVWHDGVPFDARDVVGVLSIGQTTKRRDQIGFFGVGFKSVYEICERPQIYSDVFRFEVADVSIPRELAAPPEVEWQGGTLLCLPLRDSEDTERGPAALHRRALSIPGQTLLTLDNLRELRIERGEQVRVVRQKDAAEPAREQIVLREVDSDSGFANAHPSLMTFLVERHVFEFRGRTREADRTGSTPVLVALSLNRAGEPEPLPAGNPTIFSYLPTRERSGFRFMLHAHFDLPVDRERLDLSSPWNRWALGRGGELLARAGARLAREATERPADPTRTARLAALLTVLPLDEELMDPAFRVVGKELQRALTDIPLLPGADGRCLRPGEAAVLFDERLLPLLAGVALNDGAQHSLAALPPRSQKVARAIGAASFGPSELVSLLVRSLEGLPDGSEPPEPVRWITREPTIWLCVLADSAQRADSDLDLCALQDVVLLPDQQGRLYRPAALARAEAELQAVYGVARPLLPEALASNPRLDGLFCYLGLRWLAVADLIADLEVPERSAALLVDGLHRVLKYLALQPPNELTGLAELPIFPATDGSLRPLRRRPDTATEKPEPVWLSPAGPLGEWLSQLQGACPPLMKPGLALRHRTLLVRLGASSLDLAALLDALDDGSFRPTVTDVVDLHQALELQRGELTSRLCERLARAPLFPDSREHLRPLAGPARALVPADQELVALAPQAPWLEPSLTGLSHLALLGVPPLGPRVVVQTLLGDFDAEDEPLFDPLSPADLRRVYAYLREHQEGLTPALLGQLVQAPVWLDNHDEPQPLTTLRTTPEDPALAALYTAWPLAPLIDELGPDSALSLARAFGLERELTRPDFSQLAWDLGAATRDKQAALVAEAGALRPLLLAALAQAAEALSPAQLKPIAAAALYRDLEGELRPLGDWRRARSSPDTCFIAGGVLAKALRFGRRPLLQPADKEAFAPLIAALSLRPASLRDLLEEVEGEASYHGAEAAAVLRETLIAEKLALASLLQNDGNRDNLAATTRVRPELLPIWPTMDGELRPATRVLHRDSLLEHLGGDWAALIPEAADSMLHPDAEAEAAALAELIPFRSPISLLLERLRKEARPGEPLTAQPPFVAKRERLSQLLHLLGSNLKTAELAELPVVVDAAGRLVSGPRFRASAEAIELARGLPLLQQLADPAWAAQASQSAPELAHPLPARRLIAALAEQAREATLVSEHPLLGDGYRRQMLYRWLLTRSKEIAADPQARGPLAHAHLLPARGGQLLAPRELLLEPGLPPVFDDWQPDPEMPAALIAWLRRTFELGEQQRDRLVAFLLNAHEQAVSDRDGARSRLLLGHLARVLRLEPTLSAEGLAAPEATRQRRRYKLHRRLRVEDEHGHFTRPRRLLAPAPAHWPLLAACHASPPARVSARYEEPEVVALIRLAGARSDLSPEQLANLLVDPAKRREGVEAHVALARYLASRLAAEPELGRELKLSERAWIPDGSGRLRRAVELYWPTPEAVRVIGTEPQRFPHPEFFRTAPAELGLTFQPLREAELEDVLAELFRAAASARVANESLEWLEEALHAKRIKPEQLRAPLSTEPILQDDDGVWRCTNEVFRLNSRGLFGQRRGTWSEARRWPRLADALGIPQSPGRSHLRAFLEEVALEAQQVGLTTLLAEEPELSRSLPVCLARLVALTGQPPDPLLLVTQDLGNPHAPVDLAWFGDADLLLPEPAALARAARRVGAPIRVPLLREDPEAVIAALGHWGLPTLWDRFAPDKLPAALPEDMSAELAEAVLELKQSLATCWPRLAQRNHHFPSITPKRWRELDGPPKTVCVLPRLYLRGKLGAAGTTLELKLEGHYETRRRRLLLTPAAFDDSHAVAEILVSDCLLKGWTDPTVVRWVGALLDESLARLRRSARAALDPADSAEPDHAKAPTLPRPPLPRPQQAPEQAHELELAAEPDHASAPTPPRPPPTRPEQALKQAHEPEPAPKPADQVGVSAPDAGEGTREGGGLLSRFRRWLRGDQDEPARREAAEQGSRPQDHKRDRGPDPGADRDRSPERQPPRKPHQPPHPRRDRRRAAPSPPGFHGGDSSGAAASSATEAPPEHRGWFRPEDSVGAQLDSARGWLADHDRVPRFGFSFAPRNLPLPYLYGPRLIAAEFSARNQRWTTAGVSTRWAMGRADERWPIAFEGRVPAGEVQLPLPLYSRLAELQGPVRVVSAEPGQLLLAVLKDTELSYRLLLDRAPDYDPAAPVPEDLPPALLAPTTPDEELPREVLTFVEWLQAEGLPAVPCTQEIKSFIQARYRYDPSYLEDPELARWLRKLSRGRANSHLAALHAGRDARHLGAGVCYELNVLACELLRRVGIPAAVATGWTFDRGQVAEPDHLWAMALVESDLGVRWLPVDAASTRTGRPLHAGDRPTGPWRPRAPRRQAELPRPPAWMRPTKHKKRRSRLPLADLVRVARHIEKLTGRQALGERTLRARCRELLADPEQAAALVALLRQEQGDPEE